jgi:hypothetical protein
LIVVGAASAATFAANRMATQIVMDHTGDTRLNFTNDATELLKAEERFKALISVGFMAAVRDAAGNATVTRSFDPTANETLFYPRFFGGWFNDHAGSVAFHRRSPFLVVAIRVRRQVPNTARAPRKYSARTILKNAAWRFCEIGCHRSNGYSLMQINISMW